jgi:hypothetical protein
MTSENSCQEASLHFLEPQPAVQSAIHFAVVELLDGLRFRLFVLYNHDLREYELVSKFTITRAVSAMVSNLRYVPASSNRRGDLVVRADIGVIRHKSLRILVMRI